MKAERRSAMTTLLYLCVINRIKAEVNSWAAEEGKPAVGPRDIEAWPADAKDILYMYDKPYEAWLPAEKVRIF